MLESSLADLHIKVNEWRWVVVPSSHWAQTARSFGVKPTVPAFTSFAISTTYIESNLLFLDTRIDENLQRYTRLEGRDRLRWVLAHESGHIVCKTSDERKAEGAGKKIASGRNEVCD